MFQLDTHDLAAALAETPDLAGEIENAVGRALCIMAKFDVSEEVGEARQRVAPLRRLRSSLQTFG